MQHNEQLKIYIFFLFQIWIGQMFNKTNIILEYYWTIYRIKNYALTTEGVISPVWKKHLCYLTSRHIVLKRGAELSHVPLGNTVIRNAAADVDLWWNEPVALFESIFKQFTALCICIILQVWVTRRGVWRAITATGKKVGGKNSTLCI